MESHLPARTVGILANTQVVGVILVAGEDCAFSILAHGHARVLAVELASVYALERATNTMREISNCTTAFIIVRFPMVGKFVTYL